ncbi:YidB family protein [Streptomyces lavendulae]|uniref:YidB family protein n=1 Tax=Streptomyces lavendulae TaxID=1914 RepID=UPI0033D98E53
MSDFVTLAKFIGNALGNKNGLVESVAKAILGGGIGQPKANPLAQISEDLKERGLAEEVDSWVGKGENKPITAPQVAQAIPKEVQQVAEERGIPKEEAAEEIARTLPDLVDKLTPKGRPTTWEELEQEERW